MFGPGVSHYWIRKATQTTWNVFAAQIGCPWFSSVVNEKVMSE